MTKNDLLKQIEKLSHDPIWKCYTRAALQIRWQEFTADAIGVIYCDIDRMHELNALYTHSGVDAKISRVINSTRKDSANRKGDIIASRYLNGDELIFIVKSGNVREFAERLLNDFANSGISATFSYTTKIKNTPEKTINPLDKKVQSSKNNGTRGVILD